MGALRGGLERLWNGRWMPWLLRVQVLRLRWLSFRANAASGWILRVFAGAALATIRVWRAMVIAAEAAPTAYGQDRAFQPVDPVACDAP